MENHETGALLLGFKFGRGSDRGAVARFGCTSTM